jgi:purine-binding chemotaxis protein CheW
MNVSPAIAGSGQAALAASLLVFRLDGQYCAIAADAVSEILAAVAVRPLPRQPDYIAGMFDLRGTVVPVLDLRIRFGRPGRLPELTDQFVVIRARDRFLALWVDEVVAFASAGATGWSTAGGLITGDRSLAGVAATDGGLATIHDVDAFVAQCEADAVFLDGGT